MQFSKMGVSTSEVHMVDHWALSDPTCPLATVLGTKICFLLIYFHSS